MQQFYYAMITSMLCNIFYPLFSICFDVCVPRFDSALLLIFWQLLRFYVIDFQFLYIAVAVALYFFFDNGLKLDQVFSIKTFFPTCTGMTF